MKFKTTKRMDAFAFALGGAGIAASFGAIPVVANDRITQVWDKKLRKATPEASPDRDADDRGLGWAT